MAKKKKKKKKKSVGPVVKCKYDKLEDPIWLKPHPANPNKHPEKQVDILCAAFLQVGVRSAIVVSKLSKCVVEGHGRRLAAIKLGMKKFPVEYQNFKNQDEELAHMMGDNKIAELAEMDGQMLAEIIVQLDQHNYPLTSTGYLQEECERIVEGPLTTPPKDKNLPDSHFGVMISCDSEEQQKDVYEHAQTEGWECRLLTL